MTIAPNLEAQSHPPTVFDTDEWLDAWTRTTIERQRVIEPGQAPRYLLEESPFWQGYEADAGTGVVWDKPVLTIGSVYSVYGPAYLAGDQDAVGTLVDTAKAEARDLGAAGALVFNLPPEAARQWAIARPPDAFVRLDTAYYKIPGAGADPVMGDLHRRPKGDWRRKHRRASEKNIQVVQHYGTDALPHLDRVLELFNGSAVKHGWPALYDRTTLAALLGIPNASVILADWDGYTIGAFVAFEHDRRLYLWSGGTEPAVYSEVSPYPFMLFELLSQGVERGWDLIEFGRGNDDFKRRHGFGGIHLWSLWYAAEPGDVEVYGPRLTALHDGMADVAGYPGLAQRP